jgi:hypothetical protein
MPSATALARVAATMRGGARRAGRRVASIVLSISLAVLASSVDACAPIAAFDTRALGPPPSEVGGPQTGDSSSVGAIDSPPRRKFPFFGRMVEDRVFYALARAYGTPPEDALRERIENVLARGEYEQELRDAWPRKRAQATTAAEDAVHELAVDPAGHLWLGCAAVAEARFAGQLDRALSLHFDLWETYHLSLADLDRRALPRSASKLGLATTADEIPRLRSLLPSPSIDATAAREITDAVRDAIDDSLRERMKATLGHELVPHVDAAIEPVKHRWLALLAGCSPWVDRQLPRRASE